MSCSMMVLGRPGEGGEVLYDLPLEGSARLDFGASEIDGLSLDGSGGLEISFVDGGSVTVTNFGALSDAGILLHLADGTVVDPALLESGLQSGVLGSAGNDNAVMIGVPGAGVAREVTLEAGQDYIFDFALDAPEEAYVRDGQFVMRFADGGSVVLTNYEEAMAWTDAPALRMESTVCDATGEALVTALTSVSDGMPAEEVLAAAEEEEVIEESETQVSEVQEGVSGEAEESADVASAEDLNAIETASGEEGELAEALAEIEPAAGEESGTTGNTGFGFGSTAGSDPLNSPDAVGPLGATALNYEAPEIEPEVLLLDEPAEQDDRPIVVSPPSNVLDETNLDGGPLVGTGTLFVDYGNDGPGQILLRGRIDFECSVETPGVLTSGGDVVGRFQQNDRYEGRIGGADGELVFTFEIDPDTGEYTYTQYKPFDHADPNDPDDEICLHFFVTAIDADFDRTETFIEVIVRDDGPQVQPQAVLMVDETDLGTPDASVSGSLDVDFGEDGPGTVDANGDFNATGSFSGSLSSGGVPVTVALVGDTYIGTAGGETIFTLQLLGNGDYTFQLLGTLDHADSNNPNDIITLHFGVDITDFDGDSDSAFIQVDVLDDVPVLGDGTGDVDESDLGDGPLVFADALSHNFGQEIGTIMPNGPASASAGGSPITLTSGGLPVVITQTPTGYEGTAGGTTVFTLTIDPDTGEYTYTQFEEVDHPDMSDPDDTIELEFPVKITSTDGDEDTATITIEVDDDGPVAQDDINGAEEDQFITGDVTANDDLSQDNPNTVTMVHFGGTDFTVPAGGSVTITATFGTLIMNSDGTYSYQATAEDPDGTELFTYTLRDNDGDTDTAELSIRVTPDGEPVAVSHQIAVDETNLTPGPMIFNDTLNVDFGGDGAGTIEPNGSAVVSESVLGGSLMSGGVPVVISTTPTGYAGMAGSETIFTLDIQDNGDYSFQLFSYLDHADATDPNDLIRIDFGVTIADADGDTADGNIRIHIHDDAPVAYDDINGAEEGQLITGNVVANDELSEDNPNTVSQIHFNGTDFTIPSGGSATIVANFGTLVIDSDGTYTYTTNDNDPDGTDTFTYTLRGYDGDTDTADLSIPCDAGRAACGGLG